MKWLDVHIGGQRWGVHLVSPNSKHLVDEEGRHLGRCVYTRCRIYIAQDVEESAREDVLLHELLHALLHVTGAEQAYGGDPKIEEDIVVAPMTPVLHRLLKDLGFRFPRGPYA